MRWGFSALHNIGTNNSNAAVTLPRFNPENMINGCSPMQNAGVYFSTILVNKTGG